MPTVRAKRSFNDPADLSEVSRSLSHTQTQCIDLYQINSQSLPTYWLRQTTKYEATITLINHKQTLDGNIPEPFTVQIYMLRVSHANVWIDIKIVLEDYGR